jgi:hypothetical protein
LGKFRTIFYLSIVYLLGVVILTIAAVGDRTDENLGIEGMPTT